MTMNRMRGERGAVSFGLIVGILLVLFIVYEAKQFGPLLLAQFQFQDAVVETAKFSRNKDANAIQTEVLQKASELALPISREMIKVTREPTNTRIQVNYELAGEWAPGKTYRWKVDVDEKSVLF